MFRGSTYNLFGFTCDFIEIISNKFLSRAETSSCSACLASSPNSSRLFTFSRRFHEVMKDQWSTDDSLAHASNRQQQRRSPRSTITTSAWDERTIVSELSSKFCRHRHIGIFCFQDYLCVGGGGEDTKYLKEERKRLVRIR